MNTPIHTPTQTPIPRLHFLDGLRILAFGLLVLYHVGMYYVTWDWHVKSGAASTAIEPLMQLLSPWRMSLLFFISGAATLSLLRKSSGASTGGFVRPRSARLLWPLLFGMLVIVPPQAYYEVVTKVAYTGSYLDFMGLYLQADHGFCRGNDCLTLPTWNHLWFLPYLWVYTMLAWALFRFAPRTLTSITRRLGGMSPTQILLLPALPLMLARLSLIQFEATHNLTWDWYSHAQYLSVFLLGLLMANSGALWEPLRRARWLALVLALSAWSLRMAYFALNPDSDAGLPLAFAIRLLFGLMQWWAIAAACGFAVEHLSSPDSGWRRRLGPAVFCVYILHQTVIVLLTRALLPLSLPPSLEGLVLVLLTFALCWLGYCLARRLPGPLPLLMGISREAPTQALTEQAAGLSRLKF